MTRPTPAVDQKRLSEDQWRRVRWLGVDDRFAVESHGRLAEAFRRGAARKMEFPEARFDDRPNPRTSYVVCTTFRTGSTLLRDWLTGTGALGAPTEYLNVEPGNMVEQSAAASRVGSVIPYLAAVARLNQTPNGVFGMKTSFAQFLPAVSSDALYANGLSPRFVYLIRRDLLGQAISLARARMTWEWNSTMPAKGMPDFDEEAILGALAEITCEMTYWERFFALEGIDPLRLAYEEIICDPAGTVGAISDQVGVPLDGTSVTPTSPLRQQRDELNADWAVRLRSRFRHLENL